MISVLSATSIFTVYAVYFTAVGKFRRSEQMQKNNKFEKSGITHMSFVIRSILNKV